MTETHGLNVLAVKFMPRARGGRWRAFGECLRDIAAQAVDRGRLCVHFEERLRERERIARELHDTLLQGTQALILSVQALAARTPPEDPMRATLDETLRRAEGLLIEGLDRIRNLRRAGDAGVDLAQSLATAWRELSGRTALRILVEGSPRALEPAVGDEIALIGREALSNALRHAGAALIEVQIIHDLDRLLLRIRDDGVGMDRADLWAAARTDHWGLQGMRERAACIGGRLDIRSAPGAGTEIELEVAAAMAYQTRGE